MENNATVRMGQKQGWGLTASGLRQTRWWWLLWPVLKHTPPTAQAGKFSQRKGTQDRAFPLCS